MPRQRDKVRCPFGCRETHRKQESTRRSVAYYRDPDVKRHKKVSPQSTPQSQRLSGWNSPTRPRPKSAPPKKIRLIVDHVRMVVSLIEGRPISRRQVLRMLATVLRQHTMCRFRRMDHAVAWLKKQPP